jgi:hypothetical protein
VPYRESFRRRVLRAVGIPVAELQGVHEVFKPSYRRYSPLHGMMVSNTEKKSCAGSFVCRVHISDNLSLFAVHLQQLHQ